MPVPIRRYWSQPTSENREAIRKGLNLEGMRHEYSVGIPDPEGIAPEGYTLDAALLARTVIPIFNSLISFSITPIT